MISQNTKQNIFDHFNMENISFNGRMSDIDFLKRLYSLEALPSNDLRFDNALRDIWQHTENNLDYEGNWVFGDTRFELIDGSDERFLKFVCEMIHPLVRPDGNEVLKVVSITNDWLRAEGWELYPIKPIAGGNIYGFKLISGHTEPMPSEDELLSIWEVGKVKLFISHRDKHKVEAKKLGLKLNNLGFSCFVAHDSIQPMSTWKQEIMKGLQTMDACICFITSDFYESEWTNQEVGYAIARGIPIYLFSVDKSDPKGFKLDIQAIKTGFSDLVNCIKKDFKYHSSFKKVFIDNFIRARDGSWDNAKEKFYELVGLEFDDSEIEAIARSFSLSAKYSNQLKVLLGDDEIWPAHKKNFKLKGYTYYWEYLDKEILQKHSHKNYKIENYKIIEVG